MVNNIEYEGNVKLTLWKNNKIHSSYIVKNSGTQNLFQGIALALIQTGNRNFLPNYIAVGTNADKTTDDQFNLGNQLIRVIIPSGGKASEPNKAENDPSKDDGYKAIFTAVIPSNSISPDTPINELGLFGTAEGNTMLARVVLTQPIYVELGLSLSIEWSMIINNKG